MNDPTDLSLKFQTLMENDLLNGLGFDKYELIVQRDYAAAVRARAMKLLPEEEVRRALSETPLSFFLPLSSPGNQQSKLENPTSSESVHLEVRSPIKSLVSHPLPAPSTTFLEEIRRRCREVLFYQCKM
jgi:hypothetical protein